MYGTIEADVLVAGEDFSPIYVLLDAAGDPVDLSAAGVVVEVRIGIAGAAAAEASRTMPADHLTGKGSLWEWPDSGDGTDGRLQVLFDAATTLALTVYGPRTEHVVEILLDDPTTEPDTNRLHARGALTVEASPLGGV